MNNDRIEDSTAAAGTLTFSASWDTTVWTVNIIIIVILVGTSLILMFTGLRGEENGFLTFFSTIFAILPVLLLVLIASLGPRRYAVTAQSVIVKKFFGTDVKIDIKDIYSVAPIDYKQAFKGHLRTFGSGGAFGIYGRFWSPQLGHFKAYATRKSNLVLVKTLKTPYILTPDEPQAFINAIQKQKA